MKVVVAEELPLEGQRAAETERALQMASIHTELRPNGPLLTDREALTPAYPSPGLVLEDVDGSEGSAEEVEKVFQKAT